MRLANRNPLAILYSSFLLGNILFPSYYIVLGFIVHTPFPAPLSVVLWVAACTTLLLLTLISRSKLENALTCKLGRGGRPIVITVVVAAMAMLWLIALAIANLPLMAPVEYWFSVIEVSSIATALAFIVIVFTPPSRLERFLASKFSRGNKSYIAYRAIGYLVLAVGIIFIGSKLYEYYFLPIPALH